MASASSLAHFNATGSSGERGLETVEIDPQFAGGLGFAEGDTVCEFISFFIYFFLVYLFLVFSVRVYGLEI